MSMEKRVATLPNGVRRKVQYNPRTGLVLWNATIDGRHKSVPGILVGDKFMPRDPVVEQWIKTSYAPRRVSVDAMSTVLRNKILRRMSIDEDLRLVFPDGKRRRAYYMNFDKTRAYGHMISKSGRTYVSGRVEGERIVP